MSRAQESQEPSFPRAGLPGCLSTDYLVQPVAIPAGPLPPSKPGAEIQPVDAPRCTEVTALAATKGTAGSRAA